MSIRAILVSVAIALVASPSTARAAETAQEQIIAEIFELQQLDKLMAETAELSSDQVIKVLREMAPNLNPNVDARIHKLMRWEVLILEPKLMERFQKFMTRNFRAEELRELLSFYKSDVGRKSAALTPMLMRETMSWSEPEVVTSKSGTAENSPDGIEDTEDESNP